MKKIKNISLFLRHQKKLAAVSAVILTFATCYDKSYASEKSIHDTLIEDAKKFVVSQIDALESADMSSRAVIEISPLDTRMTIPTCADAFQFELLSSLQQQSYVQLKASCPEQQWQLYLNARVARYATVVVFSSALSPNTTIATEHLTFADIDLQHMRATHYFSAEDVIGARVKQRTRPGQPVQPHVLCFVCKGDRITIVARGAGMQVATTGVALQDGGLGDSVKVMNAHSQKHLYALVDSAQQVIVNL